MKNFVLLSIFLFTCLLSYGQGHILILDSTTKEPLSLASGAFLNTKDSSIIKTFQSNLDGFFIASPPKEMDVIMQIKYVGYDTYNKLILNGSRLPDTIPMNKSGINLKQVQVSAEKIAGGVKNDTIQFNAGAFNVKQYDMAEDLLKKLPGMSVDKDGTVKAQGETINKITVDGKPFFGNDPQMVTKNIPADAIDKVEVFDRKSDQATFSGFDDGSGEKSINFTLKPDKRKAKFGRIEAGYGSKDRYESSLTYFNFNEGQQLSVVGMSNNSNKSGFTMEDASSFMSASGNQGGGNPGGGGRGPGGGGSGTSLNIGSLLNANTLGINQTSSGGVNFKDNLSKKIEFAGSYFLGSNNAHTEDRIFKQSFGTNNTFLTNTISNADSKSLSHRFNFSVEYKINDNNSLKFEPSITLQNNKNNSLSNASTLQPNGDTLNTSLISNNSNTDSWRIGGQLLFRHKFKTDGRTFSISVNPKMNESNSSNINISKTDRIGLLPGNLILRDTINQNILNDQTGNGINTNISYTEPLSKIISLELSYLYNYEKNSRDRITYNFDPSTNNYDDFSNLFSNNFNNTYTTHRPSLSLQIKKLKYQMTFTAAYQHASLESVSITENKPFGLNFNNFLPSAFAKFTLSKTRSITLNYNSNTRQPNLDDIQPVPDLSDPIHIKIGNPDLGQEFTHSIRANYRSFDMGKNQFISIFLRGDYTLNKIVSSISTSSSGIETSKRLNTDGYFSGAFFFNFGLPYKKFNFNVGTFNNYRREISFINDQKNLGDIYTNNLNLKAYFNPTDKMEFSVGTTEARTLSSYSLQTAQNSTYYDLSGDLSFKIELPWKFRVESDASYIQRTGLAAGYNRTFTIWNASITKSFIANKAFELTLKAYDLLNQNIAVNRTTGSTYIEDSNSLTLTNYYMLTARYFLNRPKVNKTPGGMNFFRGH
ncbi:MAG TPA: outer membrane beta-barrel protein [Saprospiraceae bacterium]|nr:outer membrane beta-barrel protein [Saprospiraceae bacterium]